MHRKKFELLSQAYVKDNKNITSHCLKPNFCIKNHNCNKLNLKKKIINM